MIRAATCDALQSRKTFIGYGPNAIRNCNSITINATVPVSNWEINGETERKG